MTFLKIAWRNLFRNYRRSSITLLAIAIGVAGIIFTQGYFGGTNAQMIDGATALFSGQIQMHAKGFMEEPALSKRIRDPQELERLLLENPNVQAVAPRVESQGLLSSADKSMGMMLMGVDPAKEVRVTTLYKAVVAGRYLEPGDTGKILLDKRAAERLKVGIGESLVLLTQAADGSMGTQKFELVGLTDLGAEELAFIPLRDAQELWVLGSSVTSYALRLKDRNRLEKTLAELKPLESRGLEIHSWEKFLPTIASDVKMHNTFLGFILMVAFLVVGLGIMNTISMSVMGRTREFGIMMALGTSRRLIFRIVLYESLLLGIIGILVGSIAGFGLNYYYSVKGINYAAYSEAMRMMPGIPTVLYNQVAYSHFLSTAVWVLGITLLVSLFPAMRAARLEPVEAIHDVVRATSNPRIASLWDRISHLIFPGRAILLLMAWRNLTRNTGRTLILLLAIGLALGSMIFFYSIIHGFYERMIDNSTRYLTGDIQIAREGFFSERTPTSVLQETEKVKEVLNKEKAVRAYALRIESEAILSTAESTLNILLVGIDPKTDGQITGLEKEIKEGSYLLETDKNSILLGEKIASKLKVTVGDKVVVMAQDSQGGLSSEAYRVKGIIRTGVESFDETLVMVPLKSVQSLLAMEGVSNAIVKLRSQSLVEKTKLSIKKQLAGTGNQVATWKELMPMMEQLIALLNVVLDLWTTVVFIIVLLGVMNTLLMGVMERTREFGMMTALGTRRYQVVLLVLLESFFTGLVGLLAGNFFGYLLLQVTGVTGFDMAFFSPGVTYKDIPGMVTVIYPEFSFREALYPSLMLFVFTLIAGLYPAWRAASVVPMKALRHV